MAGPFENISLTSTHREKLYTFHFLLKFYSEINILFSFLLKMMQRPCQPHLIHITKNILNIWVPPLLKNSLYARLLCLEAICLLESERTYLICRMKELFRTFQFCAPCTFIYQNMNINVGPMYMFKLTINSSARLVSLKKNILYSMYFFSLLTLQIFRNIII